MFANRFAQTTRFASGSNFIRSNEPLSDAAIMRVAPSVFATEAHESRSARYAYIPTSAILEGLRKEGFQPYSACQSKSRIEGKSEFTKHMLTFRHESMSSDIALNEEFFQINMVNSHDGTSAHRLMAGVWRKVCMNGLVTCQSEIEDVVVHHKGNVRDAVIEGAYKILGAAKPIGESVLEMKALPMTSGESEVFAAAALTLKYDDDGKQPPVTPAQVLRARRREDVDPNLWNVFNRTQESLIRGGLNQAVQNGRRGTTREVKGIDQNVKINRALWMLAEGMRKIKAS